MQQHETREAWLNAARDELVETYGAVGLNVERVRIGVGFTSKGLKSKRIGECWSDSASADGAREVFLVPQLSEAQEVLATLLHELVHAALPADAKHGPVFKRLATAVGLAGKMTATHASDALRADLAGIIEELGPYPHSAFAPLSFTKTQTTRLLKVVCLSCEDYSVRMSRKVLDMGAPICGICEGMMTEAGA